MNERFARAAAIARVDLAREQEFTLGSIRIRPAHCELVGPGGSETLEPRVMQVLVALARAQGEVVSRDDLIESCWEGRIVGEDSIGRCIARLRKAAEASGNVFAIETVSRVGYRLKIFAAAAGAPDADGIVAPVSDSIPAGGPDPSPAAQRFSKVGRSRSVAAVAAGMFVLMITGIGIWSLWPKPAPVSPDPATSVAVLPFANMSGDPAKEYFSDGFSEELLNDLSSDPRLRVVARTSAFAFKGKTGDTLAIARALHVHAIVEGSIREAANRVRIDAELIDPASGYRIWSAAYDRNLADILSVQDEVARAIAAALTHQLLPPLPIPRPKIDPTVYRLYLEGIHQFDLDPPQGWRKALAIFKQVTMRAPDFADGFAWLSRTADDLAINYDAAPAASFALASDAAQRALSLDPHNIMAQNFHALVALQAWNWREASSGLQALRSQNPDNYFAIAGLWNYYQNLGLPDEAFAEWHRLYVTDPRTYASSYFTLVALLWVGRFQEEIDVAQTQLIDRPHDTIRLQDLCFAYAATGKVAQARAVDGRLYSLQTDLESQISFQGCAWSIDIAKGDRMDALRLIRIWESEFPDKFQSAANIGAYYVLLGYFDKATDWFERAYERREPGSFFSSFYLRGLGYEKAIEKYRATAAYKALAEKPLFKAWQAEHDRIAAELAARGGAP